MSSFHFQIIALKIHTLNFYPLCCIFDQFSAFGFHVALRPRRWDDLLGTGTEWEGDRVIGSTTETT